MNIGTDLPLEVPNNPPASPDVLRRRTTEPAKSVALGTFLSVQVNIDGFGNNILGDAANEPSMAIDRTNPNRIVIGWRQFDSIASDFREGGWAYSHDGGQTWTFPGVLEEGVFRSDPVLGVDADGNFFYCSLGLPNFPQFDEFRADFFKSTDGGVTWNPFVEGFGGDKQWFTIDWTNGVGRSQLYEIWNQQFSCCGPTDFTRSIDDGASFQTPVALPIPKMKWGTLDVGPDGTLYLAGSSLSNIDHIFARSINAQDSGLPLIFDEVKTVNLGPGFTATGGINPAGLLGQVWIATDHSTGPTRGNVYIAASLHDPSAVNVLDVWLIRSTDGGDTWSAPVRINDDPVSGAWHWHGTMSVAPNGRIDVIWNDTRNDPGNFLSQVFYSFSLDGGVSWSADQAVSPPFDPSLGYPQQQKMGDYYHLVSDLGGANLAYAATFNGEQDVYFLRIPADCDGNGVEDPIDLAGGAADCNGNIILDVCESANGGPIIAEQPQGATVCQGETVIFSVLTFAQPVPAFQWRKDGGNIAGATASTLTINPVTSGDAGTYDVVVSNMCGTTISAAAAVAVTAPASCDDLDACTLDTCLAGTCNHAILQGASCDDNNPCTVNDLCNTAGTCLGTARCQLYGDVFPKGPPQGDCMVDIDDVLVVLAAFHDPDECANFPGTNLFPCGDDCPPGTFLKVDIDDILSVLQAFATNPTCPHPCPP